MDLSQTLLLDAHVISLNALKEHQHLGHQQQQFLSHLLVLLYWF